MWTDPSGKQHDVIPARWRVDGRTVELAGDPRRARRAGWMETAPAAAVRQYSKLAIVRALIGAGLFDAFAAWLDSDSHVRAQWDAASVLASDDPVFGQALPAFAAASGLTPEQIAALLTACEVTP